MKNKLRSVKRTEAVATGNLLTTAVVTMQTITAVAIGTVVTAAAKMATSFKKRTVRLASVSTRSCKSNAKATVKSQTGKAMAIVTTITITVDVNMMVETVAEPVRARTNMLIASIAFVWSQIANTKGKRKVNDTNDSLDVCVSTYL